MVDPHQVNTIVATTVCAFFKGLSIAQIGTEEAKPLAKQITEALNAVGCRLCPANTPP
ncbi:hypothetical protein [Bradyrhizobium glycinis]|uniref:hypothetical protein n=1 Tax=Bradyrhizobium glycinis TaxID=2751812 RepID=UPI0018D6DA7A|nr:hypothetical protein [Bradyrhizobium glycinis]MBH5367623.1 hypothetical protein [Bradyrhizobium glycinis]